MYVSVPVNDDDFDYKYIAEHSDGLIVMNYDQHFSTSAPGPIAAQPMVCEEPARPEEGGSGAEDHLRDRELRLRLGDPKERTAAGSTQRDPTVQEAWIWSEQLGIRYRFSIPTR